MRTNLALAATTLALASAPVAAEALRIEHDAVGCVVAERYPRIDVRLEPADAVARARVYFRAVGTADWYFVEMRREAGLFQAALPRPQKATQAIDYYVQALDTAFAESLTPEYRPTVVNNAAGCSKDMRVAAALAGAKVAVGAAAGAPALPAGFANAGVATISGSAASAGAAGGGGGLSTGLIVGLAAAGAAGVAVAAGGSDDSSSSGPATAPGPISLNITITSPGSTPNIDVSQCAGSNVTFGGGTVTLASDGTFNETWSPGTPNTLRLQGRADATSFQANLSCASRPGPTGQMSANGSNYNMSGTFSFGSQQGTLTVTRRP